jgi:hypothetical protein
MFFLVRLAFWFSLVLLLLPLDGDGGGALQALVAAREAAVDVAGLCERKPDVCLAGMEAIETVSARARAGARIAVEMLGENAGSP